MTDLRAEVWAALLAPPREERGGKKTAAFRFPSTFKGFQGHFPGNPVLPGIVQILLAELTVVGNGSAVLAEVSRCKFLRPVLPGETVTVAAAPSGKPGLWSCDLRVGHEDCARMTLRFEA